MHLAGTVRGLEALGRRVRPLRFRCLENLYCLAHPALVSQFLRGVVDLCVPACLFVAALCRPGPIYVRHYWTLSPLYPVFKLARRKIVIEVNATLFEEPRLRRRCPDTLFLLIRELERRALLRADRIIAVSGVLAARLRERGHAAAAMDVIHNAADAAADEPRTSPSSVSGVTYIGNFKPWHRVGLLIEAFAQIHRSIEDDLFLIGAGETEALESLACALGVEGRVRFLGPHLRADVWRLLRRARVLVLPHTEDYGSPLKLFEYLAAGRPAVLPDLPNIREVVRHDCHALLFRPGDAAALSRCIQTLVRRPELADRIGRNGHALILSEYTWAKHAGRIAAAVDSLEGRGRRVTESTPGPTDGPARPAVLLIGPQPPPVGGITVLFADLAKRLRTRDDVDAPVVGTGGVRGRGVAGFARLVRLARDILSGASSADVVTLHAATTGLPFMGPLVVGACRRARRPLVVRKFGGTEYGDLGAVPSALIRWTLRRADLVLVETKRLEVLTRDLGIDRVRWYPNSRPMPALPPDSDRGGRGCKRFVYVGHVRTDKGIRELVEAASRLHGKVVVDVYGTLGYDLTADAFSGEAAVNYHGRVDPADVVGLLSRYDALVLPTYHEGEGCPGVVLEAYAAGLPVIATRWGGIPEVVDDRTGVLIEPRSADALARAMEELSNDPERYARLREGVRRRREEFSSERWTDTFVDYCREIARRAGGR